jgi:hypothetical protein
MPATDHREFDVARAFRQLDVVSVVSRNGAAISAGGQRLVQNVRSPINTLVDVVIVGLGAARAVGVDAEFIVRSVRVTLPLHFEVVRPQLGSCFRTD